MGENKWEKSETVIKNTLMSSDSAVVEGNLVPKLLVNCANDIFCIRFSPDGKFLAAGCGDGVIRVYNAINGSLAYSLQGGGSAAVGSGGSIGALAITSLRFRPVTATSRTKNVFIAASASGVVQHWHMTSTKILHAMEDADNVVYALDYNDEGTKFVTAGKDSAVRVYDEATKSIIIKMQADSHNSRGHSNRIFSCKAMPGDENIILTGGWDRQVHIWDIRTGSSVRSFSGPHICGDSLDVSGTEILTGSWRPEQQLELWDLGSGEKVADVPWDDSSGGSGSQAANSGTAPVSCMLYGSQFSKEGQGKYLAGCGSVVNETKIFDHHRRNALVGSVTGLSRGVFGIDFSPDNRKIAMASGDQCIRIMDIIE